jgi:hypothetical protein
MAGVPLGGTQRRGRVFDRRAFDLHRHGLDAASALPISTTTPSAALDWASKVIDIRLSEAPIAHARASKRG